MTRKIWLLVTFAVLLGGLSLYLNRDWFAKDNIQISHRSRPSRLVLLRRKRGTDDSLVDPIVFFFDGEHEDYHRPGDEVQKIDFQKMEKVGRTVYMMLWEIANRATRPKVDKQLPAQLL